MMIIKSGGQFLDILFNPREWNNAKKNLHCSKLIKVNQSFRLPIPNP